MHFLQLNCGGLCKHNLKPYEHLNSFEEDSDDNYLISFNSQPYGDAISCTSLRMWPL